MSKKHWFLSDDDERDERGFWYHKNPKVLQACPSTCDPALNAITVGWRRCQSSSGIVETIRLPEGYRWLEVGSAKVSPDGRDLVRSDITDPDTVKGHTIFDSTGYLHEYFIFRNGKKRLERVTAVR